MRRALDKAILTGGAVVVLATILVPWAWGEVLRARREQPRPQYAAST